MPFGEEGRETGIGLALSGGGFRATLFHLGTLWRLNEMGILSQIKRFSSVSGGSITCGHLANVWSHLQFANGVANNFEDVVAKPLEVFCSHGLDMSVILRGILNPFKRPSDYLIQEYKRRLGLGSLLSGLSDFPRFVFNSTNLATGASFRFSKPYAGDYRIGLIHNPDFDVATAVAASSAFPPVLSPVVLNLDPARFAPTPGADLYDNVECRSKIRLTDGGVYDNLGLETVWNRYDTVLVSDAGAPFSAGAYRSAFWTKQAMRVSDIVINQCRALRKRRLISDFTDGKNKGAYWGIGTDLRGYSCASKLAPRDSKVRDLALLRTRLNNFSPREQGALINWGYSLCDAALRTFLFPAAPSPRGWPRTVYAL